MQVRNERLRQVNVNGRRSFLARDSLHRPQDRRMSG